MINCYFLYTENKRVFGRTGIPCNGITEDHALMITGLGQYPLSFPPPTIPDTCKTNQEIEAAFQHLPPEEPWVGVESNGIPYLYRAGFSDDGQVLSDPTTCPPNTEYVLFYGPPASDIQIVGVGELLFQRNEEQHTIALISFRGAAMICATDGDQLMMIDMLKGGTFYCY